ncbi:ABC transporter ATP-binding protein [Conexibacter woesei]|uniref:ABC transporter related protein n=1 Tax=Conexibacter woesei (strain DSM 14684 / CCUG 47730 / CIP 108061 / JCM 11494 / NBRC 100937 / ID131577) TaxID=469383 RepID=D3F6C5_CONWI|nr:ABC transporter ATP-binding protein [Conexibacter woesei]ADB50692.1 ABC transporter related protein [Conexibacter woesei DSM 14684]
MSIRARITDGSVRLGSVQALDRVSLAVEPGQFLALLGPSGSGKTTTLNVLAGFVTPDSGTVTFDGSDVTALPPHRRDLGIVFQGYALFPHMTVAENVGFPLRMRKVPRSDRSTRVREGLALVGLEEHADRAVATLSGGQRQRVALARAIVFEPRMLLLDEPLAALDKQLRDAMQLELRRLQQRVGITAVAVTHDQVEALTMADMVAVMRDGRIEQIGSPRDVYMRPATLFVADFLGEANLVPVERGQLAGFGRLGHDRTGQAVVRPEHVTLHRDGDAAEDGELRARAAVEEISFQGSRTRIRARLLAPAGVELTLAEVPLAGLEGVAPGREVELRLDARDIHVIAAQPSAS